MFKISVLGSGRWGSLIAWYLNKIGHKICLWGKEGTPEINCLIENRNNGIVFFSDYVKITSNLEYALESEYLIISINSQNLRSFFNDLLDNSFKNGGFFDVLKEKKIILCMKGIEQDTGKRLTEIVKEFLPDNKNIGIWVGPGHVKSLIEGIPTCMIVDSLNKKFKEEIAKIFNSSLIKCFIGNDIIGNEIGAASKNVLGIGAGILDALNMQSLKGALMARGVLEISKLIISMGGNERSAYGLCHLGDYEATLFSKESNNRKYGESIVTGEKINFVCEGVGTVYAINNIIKRFNLNLPIINEIYKVVNNISSPKESIKNLFSTDVMYEY